MCFADDLVCRAVASKRIAAIMAKSNSFMIWFCYFISSKETRFTCWCCYCSVFFLCAARYFKIRSHTQCRQLEQCDDKNWSYTVFFRLRFRKMISKLDFVRWLFLSSCPLCVSCFIARVEFFFIHIHLSNTIITLEEHTKKLQCARIELAWKKNEAHQYKIKHKPPLGL